MGYVLGLGFDDTIPESAISDVGGTSGVTGRSGRGLRYRINSSSYARLVILPTAMSTAFFGFAYRVPTSFTTGVRLMEFRAPDGTTVHCGIGLDATNHITLYGPAGTVIATSASVLNLNVDYYLEIKVVISDTVGVLEVRVDESVAVTFSGDTRNGAATTLQSFWVRSGSGSGSADYDDLWVEYTSYRGDKTVEQLDPNGNGSSSQFPGSDGNNVDNYLLVDDPTTSNMTDYVGDSVSGHIDLYTMSDLPAGYSVDAIQEKVYAQKSDAGTPPTLVPVAKGQAGTTRADTALPALSTTAQAYLSDLRTTDPDGNALTAARVNAMEVGVKIQ